MSTIRVNKYEEASALCASGAKLACADYDPEVRRVIFTFDDPKAKTSGLLESHRLGNLQVSSLEMANALGRIKDLIFSKRPANGRTFNER